MDREEEREAAYHTTSGVGVRVVGLDSVQQPLTSGLRKVGQQFTAASRF